LLSEAAAVPGEYRRVLQEPGYALKTARLEPHGEERWLPPGQGQVVLVLAGRVRLRQRTAPTGADALAAERDQRLVRGDLAMVPNDAHWSLTALEAESDVVVLSTSVARMASRETSLLAMASGMRLRNTRQLFANQRVTVSMCALRPRVPLRRTLAGGSLIARGSALLVVDGLLQGEVLQPDSGALWRGQLPTGSLLDLPRGGRHKLRARGPGLAIVLLIEPRGQSSEREAGEPFSPFVDG